jgi:hypothetical protein
MEEVIEQVGWHRGSVQNSAGGNSSDYNRIKQRYLQSLNVPVRPKPDNIISQSLPANFHSHMPPHTGSVRNEATPLSVSKPLGVPAPLPIPVHTSQDNGANSVTALDVEPETVPIQIPQRRLRSKSVPHEEVLFELELTMDSDDESGASSVEKNSFDTFDDDDASPAVRAKPNNSKRKFIPPHELIHRSEFSVAKANTRNGNFL